MEDFAKKKRSPNFSTSEEYLLVSLVNRHKDILENKQTDTSTTALKNKAWKEIENEFNAESGETYRSAIVLRKKYENIKKRTKQKVADEKCYRLGTGGGPSKEVPLNKVDNVVIDILGETRIEGLQTEFGGDAETDNIEIVIEDNSEKVHSDIEDLDCDATMSDMFKENEEPVNWSTYTPTMLKNPKSKKLTPKYTKKKEQEREVTNKVSQWADVKAQVEKTKQSNINEEHTLKLKLLQEKHDEEIKIMRNEHETRLQRMKEEGCVIVTGLREEQKFKIDILKIQKEQLLKNVKVNKNY